MKQEMPRIPNSNYNLFKKGSKLILSAATFGVVAAGSFQGVNYVVAVSYTHLTLPTNSLV